MFESQKLFRPKMTKKIKGVFPEKKTVKNVVKKCLKK